RLLYTGADPGYMERNVGQMSEPWCRFTALTHPSDCVIQRPEERPGGDIQLLIICTSSRGRQLLLTMSSLSPSCSTFLLYLPGRSTTALLSICGGDTGEPEHRGLKRSSPDRQMAQLLRARTVPSSSLHPRHSPPLGSAHLWTGLEGNDSDENILIQQTGKPLDQTDRGLGHSGHRQQILARVRAA
ncbi:hypothetical protein NQZ68_028162, partial [Dissostichus eleginoides]